MQFTSRQRFIAACKGENVDRPPVWIMRQAGRTLPEYRALRERIGFIETTKTPALAAEVTLQPVRRFPLDAAIIFSDILVVPEAMGLKVAYEPKLALSPRVETAADVESLKCEGAAETLGYVPDAMKIVRTELGGDKAMLGFAGAPFTVASYMIEGGGSKSFSAIKRMMFREPQIFRALLAKIADVTAKYLAMQIEAGADAVQLFDSWAGELSPAEFEEFALPNVQTITEQLSRTCAGTPVIYYVNGVGNVLENAARSGAAILGIDWRIPLSDVRRRLGSNTVLQGNLDPGVLFAAPGEIRRRTNAMLAETGGIGHIANLGHGVAPDTPLEGIEAFINAVAEWKNAAKGAQG